MMRSRSSLKISVCLATRNGEKHIREQLESILLQLHPDDEVIVSDDSSTDRTIEIISQFSDCRIRLFENNTFFSPIFNFENALKHATKEIIVLSDQDDVWLVNKVKVIRERFQQSPSRIHLIVLDGSAVDETGAVIAESIFRKINAGKGVLKNIYDNTYMGCCMAFSRPLLEIALPFPKHIPMHDMWLGLLAELFGTVEFVREQTIKYRKHASSTTGFSRRFMPLTQIRRRLFLAWYLGTRFVALKLRWKSLDD